MNNTLYPIDSPKNEQLINLAKLLRQKKERSQQKLMVLEGIHLVCSYLEHNPGKNISLFIHQDKLTHTEIQTIISSDTFKKILILSPKAFAKIKELSSVQDILAIAPLPEKNHLSFQESCVVLEQIQDSGNIGTILRSAAAAGIKNIILDNLCADIYSPKVLRAAMGAHFLLNIVSDIDLSNFIEKFQGLSLATALNSEALSLYQIDLTQNIALIMGNEGAGVSKQLQNLADHCIHIPMLGQVESLNVAMATTICLFERVRQLDQ